MRPILSGSRVGWFSSVKIGRGSEREREREREREGEDRNQYLCSTLPVEFLRDAQVESILRAP